MPRILNKSYSIQGLQGWGGWWYIYLNYEVMNDRIFLH